MVWDHLTTGPVVFPDQAAACSPGGLGAEPLGQSLWRSQRDCETQRRVPIENKSLAERAC